MYRQELVQGKSGSHCVKHVLISPVSDGLIAKSKWGDEMRPLYSICLLLAGVISISSVVAQMPEVKAGSVNDVMLNVITPATNTIWGIEDPQTDEEWSVYIDAAQTVVDAAMRIKAGGTGSEDANWAAAPEWQRYADILVESGREIGAAAARKDLDRLIEVSSDMMYPPCEECHFKFHPAMQDQEYN